ncbi:hypothetical protein SDC9_197335 [bioreactor metagenome]|uniref:Uncharacterized protein n=1 Tax=bioreactor metagenome TaxID=1076179 RepID=A0A645IR07_9ZZZZ
MVMGWMDGKERGFIDDDKIIIFVNDIKITVSRLNCIFIFWDIDG